MFDYSNPYYTVSTEDGDNVDFTSKAKAIAYAKKVGAKFVDHYDEDGDLIDYIKVAK